MGLKERMMDLDKARFGTILQDVVKNNGRLASCARHKFLKLEKGITSHLHCIHCNGRMSFRDVMNYAKGFVHAGGARETVYEDASYG